VLVDGPRPAEKELGEDPVAFDRRQAMLRAAHDPSLPAPSGAKRPPPCVYARAAAGTPDAARRSIFEQGGAVVVRIDVADAGRAKELVRVLVTHVGAEPVSLDPRTGAVCVEQRNDEGLALTLGAVDAWMQDADVAVISFSDMGRSFTMKGTAA
jgi:hypothetical protein